MFDYQVVEGQGEFTLLEAPSRAAQLIRLLEMARIGEYDNHLVYLYPEPQKNPSFHIQYKKEWEVVLQIKDLAVLEQKTSPFPKGAQLPSAERKALLAFFHSPYGKITTWEFILMTWGTNNPKRPVDLNLPIPE